jgi:plastocyanin
MKRFLGCAVMLLASLGLVVPALSLASNRPADSSGRTYTVLVGLEQPNKGIDVEAYFPRSVTIHVGDTVHWAQNANEIHTVTFPDGVLVGDLLLPSVEVPGADPAISPLVFNPGVVRQSPPSGSDYRGGIGGFANSGLMGREPGQVREYDLTFVAEGTFGYFCVVHGSVMSGQVVVVGPDEAVPSPNQALAEGRKQIAEALSLVPGVVRDAAAQVVPPEMNEDGTLTHKVLLGYGATVASRYGDVAIDLMQFFPDKLTVRPGDTVTFEISVNDVEPHTATLLNGAEEPPVGLPSGGFLYVNPAVLFPQGTGVLTRTGVYSSGLLLPGAPEPTYSLVVGDITPGLLPFLCLLHDTSGMTGKLMVVPR